MCSLASSITKRYGLYAWETKPPTGFEPKPLHCSGVIHFPVQLNDPRLQGWLQGGCMIIHVTGTRFSFVMKLWTPIFTLSEVDR